MDLAPQLTQEAVLVSSPASLRAGRPAPTEGPAVELTAMHVVLAR